MSRTFLWSVVIAWTVTGLASALWSIAYSQETKGGWTFYKPFAGNSFGSATTSLMYIADVLSTVAFPVAAFATACYLLVLDANMRKRFAK